MCHFGNCLHQFVSGSFVFPAIKREPLSHGCSDPFLSPHLIRRWRLVAASLTLNKCFTRRRTWSLDEHTLFGVFGKTINCRLTLRFMLVYSSVLNMRRLSKRIRFMSHLSQTSSKVAALNFSIEYCITRQQFENCCPQGQTFFALPFFLAQQLKGFFSLSKIVWTHALLYGFRCSGGIL